MKPQGCVFLAIALCCCFLPSCLGSLWTGATLVYDRHNVYKKVSDYQLGANINHALYDDQLFRQKNCALDIAVFNGDILLAGHLPSTELRDEAVKRVGQLEGYRRLINQIQVESSPGNSMEDSWITAKIRSRIFADSSIDPNAFKIITSDRIVYLMGDVRPKEAARVIYIARTTKGVERVVKLLQYYHLSQRARLPKT